MDSAQDVPRDQSRGVRLPPLQTSFDKQVSHRPHRTAPAVKFPDEQPYGGFPCERPCELRENHISPAPDTRAVNLKRRTSRFGLAGLFSRSRAPGHEGKQERLAIPLEGDEGLERLQTGDNEASQRIGQISVSEEIDALPSIGSPATYSRHRTSKPNLKTKSSFKKEISIKTWDPPPLFQAYPQAVKHATLRAPSLPAESIIRLHANRSHGMKPRSDSFTPDPYPSRDPKEKRLKRNNAAAPLSKGDWTRKIFVLVTSGYFLQYAGDGSFDRFPEKIMPLTKESAAFASDVIPGQPYVLQVSQVSDDQGTLDKDASRSVLKKLGLRSEMRRSTSTFLLVLECPDEMNTWLVAVRREIQAIGGKEYNADEFRRHPIEEPIPQLQQKPSQRYLVKRDPNRFSEKPPAPPSHHDRTNTGGLAELPRENVETSIPAAVKRQSLATQRSIESRSVSNATASINQIYLDRLRESHRQSYASTAAKTTSTSRGSSPKLSPERLISEVPDLSCEFVESQLTPSTYPGSAHGLMHKGSSANASHRMPVHKSSLQESSLYTPQHRRTSSPTTPNFSSPTLTKRYSTSPALSSTTLTTRGPPITLHHNPSSPPAVMEEGSMTEKRTSTIGELQHLRNPSPQGAGRIASVENDTFSMPPHPSGSCNPPPSSEGEKRFSCRLSSLEYSRGISPLQLARQSPSPHPPPTAALPALPRSVSPYRASLIPPHITALPPIPLASKRARYSMLPPPTTSSPAVSVSEPSSYLADPSPPVKAIPTSPAPKPASHVSLAAPTVSVVQPVSGDAATIRPSLTHGPAQGAAKVSCTEHRMPHGPVHMEVRSDGIADQPPIQSPQTGLKTAFRFEGLTPPLDDAPPKLTCEPPRPHPQQDAQGGRSISRVGREPPPVLSPVTSPSPRTVMPIPSRADSYFDRAAPHPFIPPIRVSERKFRGSLDGPWNPSYGSPQRTFLDLSVM